MNRETNKVRCATEGDILFGFELIKKEYVKSKDCTLYTMKHVKTGAELIYFDRRDENKTFAISFKTLPEDSTGVFHILEHSVLNGSKKYPVKEPFVSMLQSSMQTFLNAMTFSDKTVYPVASRNDQDFFNLTSVYLDAVFCPAIYERPEIFMQEGWHYEFENKDAEPYYNGVVFNEMKGVYADVDSIIEEEAGALLFPDNSYGFSSGGHPAHITDLTYEQFIDTHKRFYHPSNSQIFLDGDIDIDTVLEFIDAEYLSKYEYREADFDFVRQEPRVAEKTVTYEATADNTFAHIAIAKILCDYTDVEKIYAANILADYLAGSNEAPLKRAFLEKGIAQDVMLIISDGIYQPTVSFVAKNTSEAKFDEIKALLADTAQKLAAEGLNKKALAASIAKFSFRNKQIREPYGVMLAINALSSWLYGGDPLVYIDNEHIFTALKEKLEGDYFERLFAELFADNSDKSYLYVLPSQTKGEDDARAEHERLLCSIKDWSEDDTKDTFAAFTRMSEWQTTPDNETTLATLPHLNLADIPLESAATEKTLKNIGGCNVLSVKTNSNGIVYLKLYFDASDMTLDELRNASVALDCLANLSTKNYPVEDLQNEIKAKLGAFSARIQITTKQGDIKECTPHIVVSASMLEENAEEALKLVEEILLNTNFDDKQRISDMLIQQDYGNKQALIAGGHKYAITKSLCAFSKAAALKEQLDGESFVKWFGAFTESFKDNSENVISDFKTLCKKAFAGNKLFIAYSGNADDAAVAALINALPTADATRAELILETDTADSAIEIPASVGFSSLGHNIYALGSEYTGSFAVLSSFMTFSYLWNMVRVQGGAYGTGMNISKDGDIFCYSFRDPALENTRNVLRGMADFLTEFASQGTPLDDIIIGAVNSANPLLDPADMCAREAMRYLCGMSDEDVAKTRREILQTTNEELLKLADILRKYGEEGKFCAVGDKNSVQFISKE